MGVSMRSRRISLTLSLCLAFAAAGCNKPPSNAASNAVSSSANGSTNAPSNTPNAPSAAPNQAPPAQREPLIVRAGTSLTVRLGSALGSKISQTGDSFNGTVARDVIVGDAVAIPRDTPVSGTVADAKPLGRFAGGAVLEIHLNSINLNGVDTPVKTAMRDYSEKGKGKRTAVMAGGGAALGALIGGLAGGGKGAAIGAVAGGGAGTGGAAFTGNKEIVLPAESAVTFELTRPLEIQQ